MIEYYLTSHAKERLRQRYGIVSKDVAISWINDKISQGKFLRNDGNKKIYRAPGVEIVLDKLRVVTVKPLYEEAPIMDRLKTVIEKEVSKLIASKELEFRKAEISVAELTLNMLKARNPKIKDDLRRKLTKAIDYKENIQTEIISIKKAAEHYGVGA